MNDSIPEGKVIVARGSRRGTKRYHTKRCGRLPAKELLMDKDMAIAWEFELCTYCDGRVPHPKPGRTVDTSYQDALKEAAKND